MDESAYHVAYVITKPWYTKSKSDAKMAEPK